MTWGDAMKDIKEKPTAHMPRSNATGEIPKAALKKAWAEAKEKSRTMLRGSTSTQGDGDYTTAQDTSSVVTDTSYSVIKQNTDFTVQQGRKIARKQIEKYRERRSAEQTETTRAHTAGERNVSPKQTERGTLPDAEQRPRCGADLPRQRAKEKAVTAKTVPRDIRGVTQSQRQLRTAANETVRSVTTKAQMHTRTRQVQLAIQKAAANTRKMVAAVRSAIRHFLASLHSLVVAIATGISVVLSIIIVISLVAFVSGSAYGIFFAADAPNENAISVQEAVEILTGEYHDRLEEISNTIQHDRQDIVANDDVYFIRWQDVLAVFSSYVSGNELGSPVASLEEEQVDKLREIMWAMNAVGYSTHPETTTINTTDEDGNPTTTEITETILVIELTHKTPDEMAADYHFTTRQNTYLQLLQDPQYEELWAELLGGFAQNGGGFMNPDDTRTPTGTLQWPLPVAGTITSQFGHRVDPITGEVSSHTGTDIACAEGTPILAAADGVITVANGLDSWGGSYGYYIQINHGGGLETLYAHCSSICVTTGQQVQAGQVIGYVGHTGRATGSHLHLEVHVNGSRADAMSYFGT
jgi:murein DD-endopeptidase MepM/ murein hydrolase activator NlpD